MTINTIKGFYTYNRLPQGAASSAAIFQKIMDVLHGIEGVSCYLDEVLIAANSFEDCKAKLLLVLDRLEKAKIKVKLDKCRFFVDELPFLGHVITKNGLVPCPDKIATISNAKSTQ